MKIPEYARYDYCVMRSCEFLEEFNISHFPINPYKIIETKKWGLITYSEMAENCNCTIKDVINSLKSYDGFTIYDEINYTIAYNDTQPKKRILFTLLHEIGHIYLNHLIDFEHTRLYRGSLTKSENKVLENEANTFARNVLVPSAFVSQLKDKTKMSLSRYFGISYKAAEIRLELLEYDWQCVINTGIQQRLLVLFNQFFYRSGCEECNAVTFIKGVKYCPICGSKKLKWGVEEEVIYESYNTYENNKVIKCPICGNEETNIDGLYCQICGVLLVNYCDDRESHGQMLPIGFDSDTPCGKPVPVNARYCPYCGSKTTFYNDGLLKSWKEDTLTFMSIPDIGEEELPFN